MRPVITARHDRSYVLPVTDLAPADSKPLVRQNGRHALAGQNRKGPVSTPVGQSSGQSGFVSGLPIEPARVAYVTAGGLPVNEAGATYRRGVAYGRRIEIREYPGFGAAPQNRKSV